MQIDMPTLLSLRHLSPFSWLYSLLARCIMVFYFERFHLTIIHRTYESFIEQFSARSSMTRSQFGYAGQQGHLQTCIVRFAISLLSVCKLLVSVSISAEHTCSASADVRLGDDVRVVHYMVKKPHSSRDKAPF